MDAVTEYWLIDLTSGTMLRVNAWSQVLTERFPIILQVPKRYTCRTSRKEQFYDGTDLHSCHDHHAESGKDILSRVSTCPELWHVRNTTWTWATMSRHLISNFQKTYTPILLITWVWRLIPLHTLAHMRPWVLHNCTTPTERAVTEFHFVRYASSSAKHALATDMSTRRRAVSNWQSSGSPSVPWCFTAEFGT